jgi:hypothetical protein
MVILKIDFKKAYDKVKWSFLQQFFRMKVFWRALIPFFKVVLPSKLMITLANISKKGLR